MARYGIGAIALAVATAGAFALGIGVAQAPAPAVVQSSDALPPVPAALAAPSAPTLPADERAAFEQVIRDYLIENPEVLVEAFSVLEERQMLAEAQADFDRVRANADALWNDPESWVGGNLEGEITIVEFVDYKCGFCKRAKPEVDALVAANADVRIIRKEFPILGPESVLASRAALAVLRTEGPDAYASLSDQLMSFTGTVTESVLRRFAERAGADPDAMFAQMDSVEISRQIQSNRALAQRLGITGTPSFIFGERLVRGFLPQAQMEQTLELIRNINN
ncbi:MAG: DsbA family protein [Pseudomonadota bacterium]